MPTASRSSNQGSRCGNLLREAQSHRTNLRSLIEAASSSSAAALAQPAQEHLAVDKIQFARKELRNTYLKVLFSFTFSSQAHGIEQSLWRDTTLSLVNLYRARLSALQKVLEAGAAAGQGGRRAATSTHTNAATYKRLADTYRGFLSSEETFWRDLSGRIVRFFHLREAVPQLAALGIPIDGNDDDDDQRGLAREEGWGPRSATDSGLERFVSAALAERADAQAGDTVRAERLPEGKARLLEIVHKALIFCGDLARYRELLKGPRRSGTAPSTHSAAAPGGSRRGKGRGGGSAGRARGSATSLRADAGPQDFSVAAACYEQARQLLPHSGHPSNQLAVISTYTQDYFSAIYHYYRALCVRVPFDTARTNLELSLRKVVEAWARSDGPERIDTLALVGQDPDLSALSAEALGRRATGEFIALLGSISTRTHLAQVIPFATQFQRTLDAAVSARGLQTDAIVRMVIIALAASWTTRLWRSSTGASGPKGKAPETSLLRSAPINTEYLILLLVLGTFKTLVDVGAREVRSASAEREHDLQAPRGASDREQAIAVASQKITAVFRRTLPALRLASKWLKSHLEYVNRCAERALELSQWSQGVGDTPLDDAAETTSGQVRIAAATALASTTADAWRSYVDFCNALRSALPFESLPSLGTAGESADGVTLALEEDLDVRGFLPTRKGMLSAYDTDARASQLQERPAPAPSANQLHPNEEQLMRIADLLIDAKLVAESEASPLRFDDTHNNFVVSKRTSRGSALSARVPLEDGTANGDDGEDEVILIRPNLSTAGHTSPRHHQLHHTFAEAPHPSEGRGSEPNLTTSAPLQPPLIPLQAAAQPHLLFGGVGSHSTDQPMPHASIWAPGPGDLQRLSLGGAGSGPSSLLIRPELGLAPAVSSSAPWPRPGPDVI